MAQITEQRTDSIWTQHSESVSFLAHLRENAPLGKDLPPKWSPPPKFHLCTSDRSLEAAKMASCLQLTNLHLCIPENHMQLRESVASHEGAISWNWTWAEHSEYRCSESETVAVTWHLDNSAPQHGVAVVIVHDLCSSFTSLTCVKETIL